MLRNQAASAARLDLEEVDGTSYLDNTLLIWTQESGMSTHDPVSIPIVTAGGAAGRLQTGLSLDYRRIGHIDSAFRPLIDSEETYAGLLYNQFLATVLQAMGLTPREFELWGHRGYGLAAVEPPGTNLPLQSTTKTPQAATFKSPATYCPSLAEPSTAP